jgi:peptidoglycan/xylan/chitin deacetylase (PgdA/CDA1 family)
LTVGVNPLKICGKKEASLSTPLILLYHRVAEDSINSQLLSVSPENFDAHLSEVARNYRVLPLGLLMEELRHHVLEPDTLAITFDDGYSDNLTNAFPLLIKHRLPAAVFLTAGMIGADREFWWDAIERIFLENKNLPDRLEISISNEPQRFDLTTPWGLLNAHEKLCETLRRKPIPEINRTVDELLLWADLFQEGRSTHRVLNARQIELLSTSPLIEIGSHSLTHTMLSVLPIDQQQQEISHSKEYLEELTKQPVRFFSYPYGASNDFTRETMQIVANAGYEAAVANIQGNVLHTSNMYAIPRCLVRNWNGNTFGAWLKEENKNRLEIEAISSRAKRLLDLARA